MRARLIALLAAGATIVAASPGMAQDRQALQSRQIAAAIAPLSQLAEQIPDGAELIDLYKAARTVADVEAANGKVKAVVGRAQSVASDLARLHAAKMTVCEDVEQSHLEASRSESAVALRHARAHRRRAHEIAHRHAPESCGRSLGIDQGEGRREPLHGRRTRIGQAQSADARARESDPGRRTKYPHRSGVMPTDPDPAAVRGWRHAIEQGGFAHSIASDASQAPRERCGQAGTVAFSILLGPSRPAAPYQGAGGEWLPRLTPSAPTLYRQAMSLPLGFICV